VEVDDDTIEDLLVEVEVDDEIEDLTEEIETEEDHQDLETEVILEKKEPLVDQDTTKTFSIAKIF